jgi:predicted PurR-regulated permease PerM
MEEPRPKLERTIAVAVLVVLLCGCLLVMRPFISALLWAAILSFSLWPLHGRVVKMVGGRRTLASLILAFGLGLVVLVPSLVVGLTLADNVQELSVVVKRWMSEGAPSAPAWLAKVPLVGPKAVEQWNELAADSSTLIEKAKTLIEPVSLWLLKSGVALGRGLLELALSFLITFFLLRDGVRVSGHLSHGVGRIAGARGQQLLIVAGKTVRGVVYGILGTAFFQAVLAAIGYVIAGVPGVPLLAMLTFVLCIVPAVGAPMVWIPAVLWLFHQGATGHAIFLIVWGIGVSSVDNFVKPWLISHGSDMPFLLVFFGALGGLAAFGFIGLFIGPTLLAVTYKLVQEWISTKPGEGSQSYDEKRTDKETAQFAAGA